ncbi:MAG: glycoside hydrolase family 43 protein [Clostridia bacterium]|nr:glycoside hydrolase family 43 protein [Clostridia bacterium]
MKCFRMMICILLTVLLPVSCSTARNRAENSNGCNESEKTTEMTERETKAQETKTPELILGNGGIMTYALQETVGVEKTSVATSIRAGGAFSIGGLFVGKEASGKSAIGYDGYCLLLSGEALTLYRCEEAMIEIGSRRVDGLREAREARLRMEIDGGVLRAYLLDDAEGVAPWPEFEIPIEDRTGDRVGYLSAGETPCVYSGLSVSFGDGTVLSDETYENPIYPGYADPDVLYHDGVYYLYATGGSGGYRVHTSSDLVHWKDAGVCLPFGLYGITKNYWAPDVEYIDGKFYMVTSCNETLGMAVSDSPLGPFVGTTDAPLYAKSIDGHLFVDDDGRRYLYFVSWRSTYGIYGVELDENMRPIASTERLVIRPTEPWEKDRGNVTEGPYMLKRNGVYYLTYSGSHYESKHYAVGYATATSPLGTYEKYALNPIMIGNAYVSGVGHHCVLVLPDRDEMYVVYHCHNSTTAVHGRKVCIDRMRFSPVKDGIDRLEIYGPTVVGTPVP